MFSCDCGAPSPTLWHDHLISKLDHDDAKAGGRRLTSSWCTNCGEGFCTNILAGESHRDSVDGYRALLQKSMFQDAIQRKHAQDRARARGLRQIRALSK